MPQLTDNSDPSFASAKLAPKQTTKTPSPTGSGTDDHGQEQLQQQQADSNLFKHANSACAGTELAQLSPQERQRRLAPIEQRYSTFLNKRIIPQYTSSFLRPGSCFIGTQQSGRSTYEVNVELKYVDMAQSFLCGYLRIQGLTEDHPMLTTYFEGEMVGPKYSFYTRRAEWSTSDQVDMNHWRKFPAWRSIADEAVDKDYVHENFEQRDEIFMRWKEQFLVPDWKVQNLQGASYAGFYYICLDQVKGVIRGFYFHKKSDKFQQLDLTHMPDSGSWPSYEFRWWYMQRCSVIFVSMFFFF